MRIKNKKKEIRGVRQESFGNSKMFYGAEGDKET
jgi:hypothetical protein